MPGRVDLSKYGVEGAAPPPDADAPPQAGRVDLSKYGVTGAAPAKPEGPYVRRFKEAGHEVMQDVREAQTRQEDVSGLHGIGKALTAAVDQQNPWHTVKFGLDLLNVPLAAVGGTAEHGVDWAQKQTGLAPAEVNLPSWLKTGLQVTSPAAAAGLELWNRQARHPESFARHAGDVAEMVTPIPGVEAVEGLADLGRVAKIMREQRVPRSVAQAMLREGRVPPPHLTPREQAAGELEGAGHRVLGVKPEVADDNWRRWVYNRALADIGEKYPHTGPTGHRGYELVHQAFMDAYDHANASARGYRDVKWGDNLKHLQFLARRARLEPESINRLNELFDTINRQFDSRGRISGKAFGNFISDIRKEAGNLRRTGDTSDKKLADLLVGPRYDDKADSLLKYIKENMNSYSPKWVVERLKNIDRGYSKVMRINDATTAAGAKGGNFTPNHLMSAAKRGAKRAGSSGAFAKGQAVMQHEAGVGRDALEVPKRKSAAREIIERIPIWATGAWAGHQFGAGLPFEGGLLAGSLLSEGAARMVPEALTPRGIKSALERRKLAKVATTQMGQRPRTLPRGTGGALTTAGTEREQEQ